MQIYYEFFISATISSPNMTRDSNELRRKDIGNKMFVSLYSRTPVTRTLKENEKLFELPGF